MGHSVIMLRGDEFAVLSMANCQQWRDRKRDDNVDMPHRQFYTLIWETWTSSSTLSLGDPDLDFNSLFMIKMQCFILYLQNCSYLFCSV